MPAIHETATLTSKGQITLPKPIRQVLGVGYGGKVAFVLQGSKVVVSRVDDDDGAHEDPAIGSFLSLLENDVRAGRHVRPLPRPLLKAMLAASKRRITPGEDIEGDVAL